MRVRQLYGSRANEIVEMPYVVAQRALASGTVEEVETPPVIEARAPRPPVDEMHEHRDQSVVSTLRRGRARVRS